MQINDRKANHLMVEFTVTNEVFCPLSLAFNHKMTSISVPHKSSKPWQCPSRVYPRLCH